MAIRVRVPAEVRVTERASDLLMDEPSIREALERNIDCLFSTETYFPGGLRECSRQLLRKVSEGAQVKDVLLCLHKEACKYIIKSMAPIKILISVKEDIEGTEKDVKHMKCIELEDGVVLYPYIEEKEVLSQLQGIIRRECERRGYFRAAGIWAIGSTLLTGSTDRIIEQSLFLAASGKYFQSLSALGILGHEERCALMTEILLLCKSECGNNISTEYTLSRGSSRDGGNIEFISEIRRILSLYIYIDVVSPDNRSMAMYAVASFLSEICCGEEQEVRALLNIAAVEMLQILEVERNKQILLLVDAAQILETQRDRAGIEYGLSIYRKAKEICSIRDVRDWILRKIIIASTAAKESASEIEEVVNSRGWMKHFSIIDAYVKNTQKESRRFICADELSVQVERIAEVSPQTVKKEEKYRYAKMKYVKGIKNGEQIKHMQEVRIKVKGLTEEIKEKCAVTLSINGQEHILDKKMYIRITLMHSGTKKEPETIQINGVNIFLYQICFAFPLRYTIEVVPEKYICPWVKYKQVSAPFGITCIYSGECVSVSKEVFISRTEKRGYKLSSMQVFYVQDTQGLLIRVETPHIYTEEKKPTLMYKINPSSSISIRIKGEIRKVRIFGPWKKEKGKNLKLVSCFKQRRVTELQDDMLSAAEEKQTDISKSIYSILAHSPYRYFHTSLEKAIQYRFFSGDKVVKALGKYIRKDPLPFLPSRAGADPVLLLYTKNGVVITRIPVEKKIAGNPYSLWSSWKEVQSLRSLTLFSVRAAQIDVILSSLLEEKGLAVTEDSIWYTGGINVCKKRKENMDILYIRNYSFFRCAAVLIGIQLLCLQPLDRVAYTAKTPVSLASITISWCSQ